MVLWHGDAEQPPEMFGVDLSSGSTGLQSAGFGRARDTWERFAFRYALVGLTLALLAILGLVLHMRLAG